MAWQSHDEKLAVVVARSQFPDRDYLSCPETEIADITAHLTVVGGEIVYGAGDFAQLDEAAPPPTMPDWSPVRRFGGYGAWADREHPATRAAQSQNTTACAHARTAHPGALTPFWGARGCNCWAL